MPEESNAKLLHGSFSQITARVKQCDQMLVSGFY